jgi:hypothetical protein
MRCKQEPRAGLQVKQAGPEGWLAGQAAPERSHGLGEGRIREIVPIAQSFARDWLSAGLPVTLQLSEKTLTRRGHRLRGKRELLASITCSGRRCRSIVPRRVSSARALVIR